MSTARAVREPSVAEVRHELQLVLASRAFRQSRGLAKLLRYICGKALVEGGEAITEYTIAVDVLGKPQDFKDSNDAAVRVEVHRLRKRLTEYYEQEGAQHPVRIAGPQEPAAPKPAASRRRLWLWGAAGLVSVLALALAAVLLRTVFSSPNPILLCFGNVEGGRRSQPPADTPEALTLLEYHGRASEMMLVPDAITVARLAGLLQAKGKRYRVASQSEATFADLQNGPAVLIGLANNSWTERLVEKLRFTLERRPPGKLIQRDRKNPARQDWAVDYTVPYLSLTRDYALVVRVLDPKTEQMVVTAAGLSAFGTLAAGEFLTNPGEFRKIRAVAPRGWQHKNFELVLAADVIRGKCGHPEIAAAHFW